MAEGVAFHFPAAPSRSREGQPAAGTGPDHPHPASPCRNRSRTRSRSSRGARTRTCGTQDRTHRVNSFRLEVSSRNSRAPSRRRRIRWLGCQSRSPIYVATSGENASRTFQGLSAWLIPKAPRKKARASNAAGRAKCSPVPPSDRQAQMVRYYGWYSNKMRGVRQRGLPPELVFHRPGVSPPPPLKLPSKRWRDLILRVWHVDPLRCPVCQNPMRVIAVIDDPNVTERILRHLGAWHDPPPRPPPGSMPGPYTYEPCGDVDPAPDYENVLTD
jgi:hypothetical protein